MGHQSWKNPAHSGLLSLWCRTFRVLRWSIFVSCRWCLCVMWEVVAHGYVRFVFSLFRCLPMAKKSAASTWIKYVAGSTACDCSITASLLKKISSLKHKLVNTLFPNLLSFPYRAYICLYQWAVYIHMVPHMQNIITLWLRGFNLKHYHKWGVAAFDPMACMWAEVIWHQFGGLYNFL